MRVKELIAKLKEMPSEAKVVTIIPYEHENLVSYIEDVSLNSENEVEIV